MASVHVRFPILDRETQFKKLEKATSVGGKLFGYVSLSATQFERDKAKQVDVVIQTRHLVSVDTLELESTHAEVTLEMAFELFKLLGYFPEDSRKLFGIRRELLKVKASAVALSAFKRPDNDTDLPNYRPAKEITDNIFESLKILNELLGLEVS